MTLQSTIRKLEVAVEPSSWWPFVGGVRDVWRRDRTMARCGRARRQRSPLGMRDGRAFGSTLHISVEATALACWGRRENSLLLALRRRLCGISTRMRVGIACEVRGRNLTRSEWSELGPFGMYREVSSQR